MENAVKALEMAAGVLLGVMLMAIVAYFFSKVGTWPQKDDDAMSTEQLAKFNQAYEVYEKSQMYGVDVLSCLNKVISNNEKYAQGGAFLGGNASLGDYRQRENYWINIKIKLGTGSTTETTLKENLRVYYISGNKELEKFDTTGIGMNSSGLSKLSNAIKKIEDFAEKYGANKENYTSLGSMTYLQPVADKEINVFDKTEWIKDGYLTLIYRQADGNVSDMNPNFITLLHCLQTLSDDSGTSNLTYTFKNKTKKDYDKWTQVVWETVLYDLKSRKFTCPGLKYNTATGRVNEIVFEEI